MSFTYSWTLYDPSDPHISGAPDYTVLNRNEGYQVLYMINYLMAEKGLWKIQAGITFEKMIRQVPADVKTQREVKQWIDIHW